MNTQHKHSFAAQGALWICECGQSFETTCEYPMIGGLCGNTAKFHGKTTGIPYCQDHANLIKRWVTEELIPI